MVDSGRGLRGLMDRGEGGGAGGLKRWQWWVVIVRVR